MCYVCATMSRTKPVGVRFDPEKLEFIKTRERLKSNQQVVDLLVNKYWWEFKVPSATHKESPPLHLKDGDGNGVVYAAPRKEYDSPKLQDGFSEDEPLSFAKIEKSMTTNTSLFQQYLNGMADLVFPDDKEDYERKIRADRNLTEKQITLLIKNLRA